MLAPFWLENNVGIADRQTDPSNFGQGTTLLVGALEAQDPWFGRGHVFQFNPPEDFLRWVRLALDVTHLLLKQQQQVILAGDCGHLAVCYLMGIRHFPIEKALSQVRYGLPEFVDSLVNREALLDYEKTLPNRGLVFEQRVQPPQFIPPVNQLAAMQPPAPPPLLPPAPGRPGYQVGIVPAVTPQMVGPAGVNVPPPSGVPIVPTGQPTPMAVPQPLRGGEAVVPPEMPPNPMAGPASGEETARVFQVEDRVQIDEQVGEPAP